MHSLKVALRRTVALLALTTLFVSCAAPGTRTPTPPPADLPYWGCYNFYSDPTGAHVYDSAGNYYGQTKEGVGVGIVYSRKDIRGPDYKSTYVTLKKRGYAETVHRFLARYQYRLRSEAEANCSKVVIVLDTE